jgi:hypothetical protein
LPDRVAGLLLLLYAHRASDIARLTIGHARDDGAAGAPGLASPVTGNR